MNYFELYSLPVKFNIDQAELNGRYISLSKRSHPDMHTLADAKTQMEMLERSTLNNNAYNTLKDKLKRIKYILQLFGMVEDNEQYQMPTEFLGEMMELNEAVFELQMKFDSLMKDETSQLLNKKIDSLNQSAVQWMNDFDAGKDQKENLERVKEYYFKLKYLNRLKENIKKLDNL